MNILERIKSFLGSADRSIVYGKPLAAEGTVLALSMGDGDDADRTLGDFGCLTYQTLDVTVYADDYIEGYDLLTAVRSEITRAEKNTVKIAFKRFTASDYDETLKKHVLRSQYKIYE